MKKLNVTIQLEMSVPDDWSLVETSEGTPVLQLPDGTFMDLAIEPLFATNPEETWSSTDDDEVLNDVLDMVGTTQQLGKPAGEDALAGKVTFATLKGPEAAMQQAQRLTQEACARLSLIYGERADFLVQLAKSLVARNS